MIGHSGVFKYTERSKLTFDTSFECPNPSCSYCKKYIEKKSLCTIYKHISCTLEIMIIRTFLCRFERWPYLGNNYSLNVFSVFEHCILCKKLTVKIWRNFYIQFWIYIFLKTWTHGQINGHLREVHF